ncbi:hypothetical protein C8J57DRAFT_1232767 [Mycena rebaudengoi]|nr:hypothetical protein C8J57DRAFT_1232767 [Mycena rebaudengoi]
MNTTISVFSAAHHTFDTKPSRNRNRTVSKKPAIVTIPTWIAAALTVPPLCINHEWAWEIHLMGVAPVKGVEATLYSCKKQAHTEGIGSDHYQDKLLCISRLNING